MLIDEGISRQARVSAGYLVPLDLRRAAGDRHGPVATHEGGRIAPPPVRKRAVRARQFGHDRGRHRGRVRPADLRCSPSAPGHGDQPAPATAGRPALVHTPQRVRASDSSCDPSGPPASREGCASSGAMKKAGRHQHAPSPPPMLTLSLPSVGRGPRSSPRRPVRRRRRRALTLVEEGLVEIQSILLVGIIKRPDGGRRVACMSITIMVDALVLGRAGFVRTVARRKLPRPRRWLP